MYITHQSLKKMYLTHQVSVLLHVRHQPVKCPMCFLFVEPLYFHPFFVHINLICHICHFSNSHNPSKIWQVRMSKNITEYPIKTTYFLAYFWFFNQFRLLLLYVCQWCILEHYSFFVYERELVKCLTCASWSATRVLFFTFMCVLLCDVCDLQSTDCYLIFYMAEPTCRVDCQIFG